MHGLRLTTHGFALTTRGFWLTVHGPALSMHGLRSCMHGPALAMHGLRPSVHGLSLSMHGLVRSMHAPWQSMHGLGLTTHGPGLPTHGFAQSVYGLRRPAHGERYERMVLGGVGKQSVPHRWRGVRRTRVANGQRCSGAEGESGERSMGCGPLKNARMYGRPMMTKRKPVSTDTTMTEKPSDITGGKPVGSDSRPR